VRPLDDEIFAVGVKVDIGIFLITGENSEARSSEVATDAVETEVGVNCVMTRLWLGTEWNIVR